MSKKPQPKPPVKKTNWKKVCMETGAKLVMAEGEKLLLEEKVKRLEEIEKGLFALKEGFQQLEKELDQRCPKNCGFVPILTPEPKATKLPVTIDEVWEQENKMQGKKSFYLVDCMVKDETFSSSKYMDEFRHESTAKKVRAFCILSKIAEAQNEMWKRGIVAFL